MEQLMASIPILIDKSKENERFYLGSPNSLLQVGLLGKQYKSKEKEFTKWHYSLWIIKRLEREWAVWIHSQNDTWLRSTQAKKELDQFRSVIKNLSPIMAALHGKSIEMTVLSAIYEMCRYVVARRYLSAEHIFLDISGGGSAWPIGLSNVGIHQRSGKDWISEDKIHNPFKDSVVRNGLIAFKSLCAFAQRRFPPSNPNEVVAYFIIR
ncbi:Pre-mRNA-splicing factor 18 like protein [Aduncisulcus paluster]|uniref:Pre-mRNA-splicing factor 18 n=1 Tax=Aduncisulcus paluster TaxID=2918883 RepID=A0ABQ5JVM4_9EUKA|nr:Pre-mRNA-splicing factor 18 like protein [Aduncisulcus paluster]|eukprot:gnl/Carplike_NY0171/7106_a9807_273.p1 GENE.gnl/Carplike_NY0171/7106_a9807_273~~gnl/Carplike_NY0171/7106_a9807_273.p1  ORF type:complete len:209 (-),score=19.62 gnl/Carplike_NY0171/7106_a9807_273:14-640(-)